VSTPFTEYQSREPLRSSKERPKASYTRRVKGIDRVPSWTSSPAPRSPNTWENLHSSGCVGVGAGDCVWTWVGGEAEGERSGAALPFIVFSSLPQTRCGAPVGSRPEWQRRNRGRGGAGEGALGGCGVDGDADEGLGVHGAKWPMRGGRDGGRPVLCAAADLIRQWRGKKPKGFFYFFGLLWSPFVIYLKLSVFRCPFRGRTAAALLSLRCRNQPGFINPSEIAVLKF
jgi:hypothetical protein